MSLARVISRWTSHAPQEQTPESEAWMCGPPKPIERRTRFTLRRLHGLLQTEARKAHEAEAAAADVADKADPNPTPVRATSHEAVA